MNEEAIEETPSIDDLVERGREKLEKAQKGAVDALSAISDYARANPWIAIAGAAVIGGVIVALTKSNKPASRMDVIREWLEEAYEKLPSQKQVQSVINTSGAPDFLFQLRKKLHLK